MPSTPYTDGTGATSVSRAGSTHSWTNPSDGLHEDGIYAHAGAMVGGDRTELLTVAHLPPSSPLGASNPTVLTLKVLQHATDSAWSIRDDYVRLTKSGSPVGSNGAVLRAVETSDTNRTYSCDLLMAGITASDVDAGLVGVQLGYTCYPLDPDTFQSANWDVSVSPTSPEGTTGMANLNQSTPFLITVHWKGDVLLQPDRVLLSVTTGATATGIGRTSPEPVAATDNTGSVSVDNGQGETDSGAIQNPAPDPPPGERGVSGTHSRWVAMVGTFGQTKVTCHSTTAIVGANQWGQITHSCSAEVLAPPPVTIFVDSIQSSYTQAMVSASKHQFFRIPPVGVRSF